MKNSFNNADGKPVLMKMVAAIQENKAYLSDIDGLIADGDHGVNMNKGFSTFEKRFAQEEVSFSEGLSELGMILLNEIGGSMGPIYGTIFMDAGDYIEDAETIGAAELAGALDAGLKGLFDIVDARVGDKTLVDALQPAVESLNADAQAGAPFSQALANMKRAALLGRDSTQGLVARYGRASRLGERSRGVLDAGACSCAVLLAALADGIDALL